MCPKCKHEQSLHHERYDIIDHTLIGHHCVGPTEMGGECCCGYDGSPEGTFVPRPPTLMVWVGGQCFWMTEKQLEEFKKWANGEIQDD